jgi:hypothetical protein
MDGWMDIYISLPMILLLVMTLPLVQSLTSEGQGAGPVILAARRLALAAAAAAASSAGRAVCGGSKPCMQTAKRPLISEPALYPTHT